MSTFCPVKRNSTYLEFEKCICLFQVTHCFILAIGLQNSSYGTFEMLFTLKMLALIIKTKYKSCRYALIAQQRNQERLFKEVNKV